MRFFSVAVVSVAALVLPNAASAYCRSSTGCDPSGQTEGKVCAPTQSDDCGTPLVWKTPCVGFNVQKDASIQVDYNDADLTLQTAFDAWLNADCGNGTHPNIQVADLGPVLCHHNEYNEHGGNTNELIFHDDKWPHEDVLDGNQDIALTTVTYDTGTGEIFDADIEVNSAQYTLTLGDTNVQTDLLSVLTHEVGHFFGLAHAQQPMFANATMRPSYENGTTDLRHLSTDDINAICTTYPLDRDTQGECDFLPRHGFASECLSDQDEGTCAMRPSRGSPGGGVFFAALALLFTARSARRRR